MEAETAFRGVGSAVLRSRRDVHGDVASGEPAREEPHANPNSAGIRMGVSLRVRSTHARLVSARMRSIKHRGLVVSVDVVKGSVSEGSVL